MQVAIQSLLHLGALPASAVVEEDWLKQFEESILKVTPPITNDEARALIKLFGPDDCFGLAWSLVHLIESAPDWPLGDCLTDMSNQWIKLLKESAERKG